MMNKTKGAFESPELCSPGGMQRTSLTSVAPPFAFIQQAMDKVLNVILIAVLFIIMVSLGCTMEIAKITTHLRKRKGMALAVMAQYGIMPLTAFILAKLFQLGATESLAVLICGCCPGGNLSNIFSLALRGDMNLSITLNEKKPHYTGFIIKAGMVVILLSSAAIIVLPVANVGSGIMVVFSPSLLESFALTPFIAFLLGYVHSAVFQLDDQCRQTVCTKTSCQNIQLCSTILKVTFAPEIIRPLYFFPLLYLLLQLGTSADPDL